MDPPFSSSARKWTTNSKVYEHLPCGSCRVWPELAVRGVQQAEAMIYQREVQSA